MHKRGFTLVELLISTTIIAILATVSVGTYKGIIRRAEATTTLDQLQKIERVLRSDHIWQQLTTYYDEDLADPDNNNFVSIEDLAEYVSSDIGSMLDLPLPLPTIGNPSALSPYEVYPYGYDNDGDGFECGDAQYRGANLFIPNVKPEHTEYINELVYDDDDLDCGKVRFRMTGTTGSFQGNGHGNFFYSLSDDGDF